MNFIKNEKQLIDLTNELMNSRGTGKEIAKMIDGLIFDYFNYLCNMKSCLCEVDNHLFFTLKELRDLFFKLETI